MDSSLLDNELQLRPNVVAPIAFSTGGDGSFDSAFGGGGGGGGEMPELARMLMEMQVPGVRGKTNMLRLIAWRHFAPSASPVVTTLVLVLAMMPVMDQS